MIIRGTILGAALASTLASASQPDAVNPIEAPMRDLTWGQLNFLHTTDTHGWHGGHLQEPQYSADWGDYVSFAEHMRKRADKAGVDLLLVDTGDRVEGNGLYDASRPKGLFTYDIFREQDIDVLTSGNHELYVASTTDEEVNHMIPLFQNNYVASNLDYLDPTTGERRPFAQRYRKFKTKNQRLQIVAFGFLFDFTGNANNSIVTPVEEAIKQDWFQEAIREKADVFLVIGHIGLRMPELKAIYVAIRKQNPFTPITMFGGHAHVRDALSFDSKAFAMASGRYFETIGWMSVDGVNKQRKGSAISEDVSDMSSSSISFTRRYIDNNLLGLYHHTGLNETTFPTEKGVRVTKDIHRARKVLGLNHRFGCAPRNLWTNRAPYPHNESIYSWLENDVLPGVVTKKDRSHIPRLAILNTGGVRFDIFKGPFAVDNVFTVVPFVNTFVHIPDVPYEIATRVIDFLNGGGRILSSVAPDPRYLGPPEQWSFPDRFFTPPPPVPPVFPEDDSPSRHELRDLSHSQNRLSGEKGSPNLVPGYTTKDDVGTDGDDTEHLPVSYYSMPNCIQSKIGFKEGENPEKVDVVFLDFLVPWVLGALKLSGGEYTKDDIKQYTKENFSYQMSNWIQKNWQGKC